MKMTEKQIEKLSLIIFIVSIGGFFYNLTIGEINPDNYGVVNQVFNFLASLIIGISATTYVTIEGNENEKK